MHYYTYRITFRDLPGYFYYGRHKDDGKPYFGSPKTWKRFWRHFEPQIQILQWYATEQEVKAAEDSIIRATWTDKYSLNEHAGGHFSEETCRKNGRAVMTPDLARKFGKANGPANGKATGATNLAKIPKETLVAGGKANGPANGKATGATNLAKMSRGTLVANGEANIAKMPRERKVAGGKASGEANGKANGPANAKALNSQKWQCLVTGRILNPGNLSKYQRAMGIDTSLRKRVG